MTMKRPSMLHRMLQRFVLAILVSLACGTPLQARTLLKNICRVKGQEENTLQGLGLVVGLKGTGDSGDFLPTIRALATTLQLMGNQLGKNGPAELKDVKNVALVMVTATVPATGGRQGDQIDCVVSSIGAAKSLNNGILFMTPLQGPQVGSKRVYAFAQGPLHLDDLATPTNAKIHKGCRLEEDFFTKFSKDNKVVLVLDKNHASFQVAQDTADLINDHMMIQSQEGYLARALNQVNIEVVIPRQYRNDPVQFISEVLSLPTFELPSESRVVINERAGSVVIDGDIEIGAAVITHKNIVIEAGADLSVKRFVPIDSKQAPTAKLKALVESLNAVKVENKDIIEIIKGLERSGKLHGSLLIE
jgi:flagellar P-ring protein FlgI